jgi:hypothetical protein
MNELINVSNVIFDLIKRVFDIFINKNFKRMQFKLSSLNKNFCYLFQNMSMYLISILISTSIKEPKK